MTFTAYGPDGPVEIVHKEGDVTYGDKLYDTEGNVYVPSKAGYGVVLLEIREAVEEITDAVGDFVDEAQANLAPVVDHLAHRVGDAVEDVKDALTGNDESPAVDGEGEAPVESSEGGGAEA